MEWFQIPEVFKAICNRWHQPQIDLFATRFNNKLAKFVSPVPDPQAWAVDALSLPWEDLDPYAFPPAAILGNVVEKLQDYPCRRIILITPGWSNMPWFWDLVAMSSQIPLSLPNLLTQPFRQTPHRNLSNLNVHAWLLEPQQSRTELFWGSGSMNWGSSERINQISVWGKVGHFYKVVPQQLGGLQGTNYKGQEVTARCHWWLQVSLCW